MVLVNVLLNSDEEEDGDDDADDDEEEEDGDSPVVETASSKHSNKGPIIHRCSILRMSTSI